MHNMQIQPLNVADKLQSNLDCLDGLYDMLSEVRESATIDAGKLASLIRVIRTDMQATIDSLEAVQTGEANHEAS